MLEPLGLADHTQENHSNLNLSQALIIIHREEECPVAHKLEIFTAALNLLPQNIAYNPMPPDLK